jgi:hypothetical protein
MHEVLAAVLPGKTGYSRPAQFRQLADALMSALEAESTKTADTMLVLTTPVVLDVRSRCEAAIADSLVVAGTTCWTVGDVIDRLFTKRFQIRRTEIAALPATLNGELEFWTQQELLAQEGLQRGLDHRPEVARKLQLWRQAYLASLMKQYAQSRVEVTDAEVWEYRRFVDTSVTVPEVNLRVLKTATLEEMQSALGALAAGEDFGSVVRTWSMDSSARAGGGETGYFPVTMRPPVGAFAAAMDSGQRYGPVVVPGGHMMFEVIGRRFPHVGTTDSAALRRDEEARREVLAMKRQGLLNQFIAQTARKRGYDIYEDRLRAISVTTVPMLTYRILGFGGRMFEVPFVDPQIQWLRIEPPEEPVLP